MGIDTTDSIKALSKIANYKNKIAIANVFELHFCTSLNGFSSSTWARSIEGICRSDVSVQYRSALCLAEAHR